METGYLPVIGLCDATCHMATSTGKEGGWPSERPLCNHYVDNGLHEVTRRAQRPNALVAALCSCILLNFFNPWTAECGG